MPAVTVQLLLKDRLLQEVPFATEMLSIGRMKENEIVINNLSVSRFHAVIRKDGDQFILEDKGSENGTFVNGVRIEDPSVVAPGDEIRVGKHKLVLRSGEAGAVDAAPVRGPSDVWDSAQTYFAGPETMAKMDDAPKDSGFLSSNDILAPLQVEEDEETGEPSATSDVVSEVEDVGDALEIGGLDDLVHGELAAGPNDAAEIGTELIHDADPVEPGLDEDPLFAEALDEGVPESIATDDDGVLDLSDDMVAEPAELDREGDGPFAESLEAELPPAGIDDARDAIEAAPDDDLAEPAEDGLDPLGFEADAPFLEDLDDARGPIVADGALDALDAPVTDALPAEAPDQTSFFAFGDANDLDGGADAADAEPRTEEMVVAPPEETDALDAPTPAGLPEGYAGLIVQRAGQLERVLAWEDDDLDAGRAAECAIFLGSPEISRRHAAFRRSGDRYEVHDLDSINGIEINGQRLQSAVLNVGDVVRIEDYELTFVIDAQPIHAEVSTTDPTAAARDGDAPFAMTQLHEDITANPALGIEQSQPVEVDLLEDALLEDPEDDKPLDMVAPMAAAAVPGTSAGSDPATAAHELSMRIVVRRESLPEPLRRALVEMGPGEVRLPVELVIAADDDATR